MKQPDHVSCSRPITNKHGSLEPPWSLPALIHCDWLGYRERGKLETLSESNARENLHARDTIHDEVC